MTHLANHSYAMADDMDQMCAGLRRSEDPVNETLEAFRRHHEGEIDRTTLIDDVFRLNWRLAIKLAHRIIRHIYKLKVATQCRDYADLIGEVQLALIYAVDAFARRYEHATGNNNTFGTYLGVSIRRSLVYGCEHPLDLTRPWTRDYGSLVRRHRVMDFEGAFSDPAEEPPELGDEADYKETLAFLEIHMTAKEFRTLRLYVEGFTYEQIAQIENVTRQSVGDCYRRARKKAFEALSNRACRECA